MARNQDQYDQLRASGYLGEEIVTGEAVALDLPSATVTTRMVSGFVDYVLTALLLGFILEQLLRHGFGLSEATFRTALTLLLASFFWLIPALVTGLTGGTSLGKLLTRTRVVRSDGGRLTIRQAFVRATIGIVEVWLTLGSLALMTSALTKRGQRLGDMLAGTYVVRWPKATNWEPKVWMPDGLQGWAQSVQTRNLPTGLALNIVDFLRHSRRLTGPARAAQGRLLAASAENYVSPPPPWGTSPEDFLSALMLVRHEAELQRHEHRRERQNRSLSATERLPYQVPDPA